MKLYDVIEKIKPYKAQLITGKNQLHRQVTAIEVMEVPEVEKWAQEGLLVLTTFYAVKNDPNRQYEIIRSLIELKAAGMIIKVGRFIDHLSEEIINLAKANHFPIILLPKDVPYIKILTPLHKQLYPKALTTQEEAFVKRFENKPFSTVQDTINFLAEDLNVSLYIEDAQGRLLYRSSQTEQDGWRRSQLLFSQPTHGKYLKYLKKWKEQATKQLYFHLTNIFEKKDRLLIPLIIKNNYMIFIHLVGRDLSLSQGVIRTIKGKLGHMMMWELIELQQAKMKQDQLILNMEDSTNKRYILLRFMRTLNELMQEEGAFPADYQLIYQKNIEQCLEKIPWNVKFTMFEQEEKTYALLHFQNHNVLTPPLLQTYLEKILQPSMIADTYVAVSTTFHRLKQISRTIQAVDHMMQVGLATTGKERIFLKNKLGVNQFLIQLSTEDEVKQYVQSVLQPLKHANPVLLKTLKTYLKENGNASRTANKLYVNRRTITYRLNQIEELLSFDLKDAEHVFILQFCLKIAELIE